MTCDLASRVKGQNTEEELEYFLWRHAEPLAAYLDEIFSVLQQGERYLHLFQGELDDKIASVAGINARW